MDKVFLGKPGVKPKSLSDYQWFTEVYRVWRSDYRSGL